MTTIERLTARGRYAARAGAAVAAQPREGLERTVERVAEYWDVRRRPWHYDPAEDYADRLERLVGPLEPADSAAFEQVWDAALADLRGRGLRLGRAAFGGWDDGDVRLGRLAWWLARRLRPQFAVETGVARGLTTRVLLEALGERGRLWSIDLPPLIDARLAGETAAAVPPHLRDRWTLLRGSSHHRLPALVRQLPRVDLFVHDSMHTTRNVRFELEQVWPALRAGGAALVDDVQRNRATQEFLRAHTDATGVILRAADDAALIAVLVKRG
jgi:predicted O-methyltransferase YrrM